MILHKIMDGVCICEINLKVNEYTFKGSNSVPSLPVSLLMVYHISSVIGPVFFPS